jgi:three-Cys-motif partner protein
LKSPEYYRGREQTYLKHFFLEMYLERVAYNIGSFANDFVYVDGFSGPWKSEDDALDDTSFMIAIKKLRQVRDSLAKSGKSLQIRCLFIEKDADAYRTLETAIQTVTDIQVQPLRGEFEHSIPDVLKFVGKSFSLIFIDPTGWSGFGLKQIAPILQHRPGEVLVNFMFDYINRFLDDARPEIAASFAELFGGPGWEPAVRGGLRREDAIVELYRERMRATGGFAHVTSTRILKPTHDRSYFYLVYGTRHLKGLVEFRGVEKKAVEEQERVRLTAKQESREARTGQAELFAATDTSGVPATFEDERSLQQASALERLRALLADKRGVTYEDALAALLELPLVWESDLKRMILDLRDAHEIDVVGLKPPERTPKKGHMLVLKTSDGATFF